MTNDLTTPFGTNVDIADDRVLREQFEDTADFGSRQEGLNYMSFSGKTGQYKIGQEGRDPGKGEPFAINIRSFKIGYMCWKDGKPLAKRLAKLSEPRISQPDPDEGGPFNKSKGDGWSQARSFDARSLENGEQIQLTLSSVSGVGAIADLHRLIKERLAVGKPAWPVIVFGTAKFESQGFKNYKPTFEQIKWLEAKQLMQWKEGFDPMALLNDDDEEEPKQIEPTRRRQL